MMLIADPHWRPPPAVFRSGHEDPSARTELFLALCPDADATFRIGRLTSRLRSKYELRSRPLAARRLHVTLIHIDERGSPEPEIVAEIGAIMPTISMRSFKIAFDAVMGFRGGPKQPLVLVGDDGVAGARLMQRELSTALQRRVSMRRRTPSQYTPHVTLLYDRLPNINEPIEAIEWTVSEIVLVRRLHGRGRHIALARWPLAPLA